MTTDPDPIERRLALARRFTEQVPHNQALGLVVEALRDRTARFRLPYHPKLIGNPATGVLHGGAITSLLDGCAGAAVFATLTELQPIATLDLRIDYLRPAEPGRDVVAEATCHHTSKHVAFVRALAFHADDEAPIATAVGTFMIGTKLGTNRAARGGA
ncbi:MAG: PaaI family thioesterase [Kofleriaceae bacterium]